MRVIPISHTDSYHKPIFLHLPTDPLAGYHADKSKPQERNPRVCRGFY